MEATDQPESGEEESITTADEAEAGSDGRGEKVVDVSSQTWELSLFERLPPSPEGLYVYHNTFHLVPKSIGRFGRLKTLKFFANEIEVLPPEAGDLVDLERLQVKVSSPGFSGLPFEKLKSLTELELSKVPPRPSAFSILSEVARLKYLSKLSICHFSIRYLPPEIGCLKKLEELDLSFNKLKNLPNDIAELSSLRSLKVANNKLVDLPSGISLLRSLENLDVSNNRLTSLTSLNLGSMLALKYLNLQYNKIPHRFEIPPWICCNIEGNCGDITKDEINSSLLEVDEHGLAVRKAYGNHGCYGCHSYNCEASWSCRCHSTQRMRKGWKRRDYLQQIARQERLNHSRMCKSEGRIDNMKVKIFEDNNSCKMLEEEDSYFELLSSVDEGKSVDSSANSIVLTEEISNTADDDECGIANDRALSGAPDWTDSVKIGLNKRSQDDHCSCVTSESTCLNQDYDIENEQGNNDSSVCSLNVFDVQDENSSSEASKFVLKSKRHSDKDLDNPKPSKFLRPVDECSNLSCKYSNDSFCSINDLLPDGFYDAGRDRPFMSLQDYEQSLRLGSREVILLDRDKDEELDAIAFSAQLLMSSLKKSCCTEKEENAIDNFQRASILALFVSDCFGGSDRSASIMRIRRAIVGLNKQQPFVCTCSAGCIYDSTGTTKRMPGTSGNINFANLCDESLQLIKETRNSNVVPIGSLRFGVCRHRAVLLKYLCDRADPPIPCELVRGYLDFMPHAWNTILVRRGDSWIRMVVDACYPTDIREEMDPEYFCRYIPLMRFNVPLQTENSPILDCSFPSPSLYHGTEDTSSHSVFHCKIGTKDAAVKVRKLEAYLGSDMEVRDFEYKFLGEIRLLGALRKHSCIVDIYGHQLFSKWVPAADGNREHRLLHSLIFMEYVKGGSVKSYMENLSKMGEKHVPVDMALCIARDVACALVELHSKHIIHRDIKSENIVIDLDSKRCNGTPVVKLTDFDRSVPLYSYAHTCCIAHLGIHPPDVCVGTPQWMAPEVVQARHQKNPYGLEVDIWSYGCLLFELLTLRLPYEGYFESEVFDLVQEAAEVDWLYFDRQMKRRPRLTPELEALAASDDQTLRPASGSSGADTKILKLLVDLFYQCTSGDPADRPSASQIYDALCAISPAARCKPGESSN